MHGIPRAIISDRDSRFTSHFWEHLWAAMRTDLRRSTAFHPQTDGQTERQNRTLIEALRAHVDANQRDWDTLLPAMQLAHNSSRNHSTGVSPFEMLFGATPRTALDAELERDGVGPLRQAERQAHPGAQALAERIKATVTAARKRMEAAQLKQRQDSQRGRRECELAVGDKAWLSNRNLRPDAAAAAAGRARKLEPLYYGPYEVLAMHGSNAAELRLPAGCRLHPVFNVDLLKKFVDGRSEFPSRPVADARPGPLPAEDPAAGGPGDPVYEVEAVIGKRGRGARAAVPSEVGGLAGGAGVVAASQRVRLVRGGGGGLRATAAAAAAASGGGASAAAAEGGGARCSSGSGRRRLDRKTQVSRSRSQRRSVASLAPARGANSRTWRRPREKSRRRAQDATAPS